MEKFRPTKHHIRFLRAWVDLAPNEPTTNRALAKAADVSERQVYRWFRNSEFMEWWAQQTEKYVTFNLSKVWKAVFSAAIQQNVPAARLFVERFDPDYKPTRKTEQEHTVKLPPLKESPELQRRVKAASDRFEELRRGHEN